jgi:hypothetical protein
MSFSVFQVMERVGSREPQKIIEYIRDAFVEMGLCGEGEPQVIKQNIVEDRIVYPLPANAIKINKISVLYKDNASELITEDADRDFSATTNWTNTDFATFDTTDDLSIENDAANQSCYLDVDDIILESGRYKLQYDADITSGTFDLYAQDNAEKLGRFEDGTDNVIEFTAPADDQLQIVGISSAGTADFDNFSLKAADQDQYKMAKRIIGDLPSNYYDEET